MSKRSLIIQKLLYFKGRIIDKITLADVELSLQTAMLCCQKMSNFLKEPHK